MRHPVCRLLGCPRLPGAAAVILGLGIIGVPAAHAQMLGGQMSNAPTPVGQMPGIQMPGLMNQRLPGAGMMNAPQGPSSPQGTPGMVRPMAPFTMRLPGSGAIGAPLPGSAPASPGFSAVGAPNDYRFPSGGYSLPPEGAFRRTNPIAGGEEEVSTIPVLRGSEPARPVRPYTNVNLPGTGVVTQTPSGLTRVTTPIGPQSVPTTTYSSNYLYTTSCPTGIVTTGPVVLLGGYYYGGYCNGYYGASTFPDIYGLYDGLPTYIYNPGVIVLGQPYYPAYATPYQPFTTPAYQVIYNDTYYYVNSPERAQDLKRGGASARQALENAYPENSYQAAFAEIARAWTSGDLGLIRKHVRDNDTKISVFLKNKYAYSIASADFLQITRDAFDRLDTVSFAFTRLRKTRSGDVTAYGKHVYRTGDGTRGTSSDQATDKNTVPFDQTAPYDQSQDPAQGEQKTVYVSYTLRQRDDQWIIIAVDSSTTDLVKAADDAAPATVQPAAAVTTAPAPPAVQPASAAHRQSAKAVKPSSRTLHRQKASVRFVRHGARHRKTDHRSRAVSHRLA